MSIPSHIINEVQILLTKSLEHSIRDDEIDRLNEIFLEHPEITSLYHRFITMNLALSQPSNFSTLCQVDDSFDALLIEMTEYQKKSSTLEQTVKNVLAETEIKSTSKPSFIPRALPLVAAICMILLVMLIVTAWVKQHFSQIEVATITDIMDVKAEGLALMPSQTRLTNKSALINLTTGVMKIEFDSGVKTVVEGPADFRITSPQSLALYKGKLYARVPELGRGFRVDTPTSCITDLGTEFGIQVQNNRSSKVHMVSGQATVQTRMGNECSPPQLITEGQARGVNSSGSIEETEINRNAFIRDINSVTEAIWRGEWLTVFPLPKQNTDQFSEIHADKTYTHSLNFGFGNPVVINGVTFSPVEFSEYFTDSVFRDESLNLTLTYVGSTVFSSLSNKRHMDNVDGGMQTLLSDAICLRHQSLQDYYTLTLTGLVAGRKYSLRLYYCPDHMPNRYHPIRIVCNGEGQERDILIDQSIEQAHYMRYDYTAKSKQVNVAFYSTSDERCWHLYGLTNEVLDL